MDKNKVELHDDETEIVDEAQQMPVGTEEQSVASVAKTSNISRAKKRKGDKDVQDKKETVKAGDPEKHSESVDFADKLDNLIEEESTLSDEFKAKTAVIFEAALTSKVKEEVSRLEEEYESRLEEEVNSIRDDIVEKVDGYLNYVVESWMKENEVAIQQGLRTEIAENFMSNLKNLFVESYIEVPESKIDLVDGMAEEIAELEEKLNAATVEGIELAEELVELKKQKAIVDFSEGLADTQVDKLRELVSELDFENEDSFRQKVSVVKESYFKKATQSNESISEESEDDSPAVVEENSAMGRYLETIRKANKS